MCKYKNSREIHVIFDNNPPKENYVLVDACIAGEVENLNNNGVKTLGCCCGHGEKKPTCLIHESSINICNNMGYEVFEYSKEHTNCGIHIILLKTNVIHKCLMK